MNPPGTHGSNPIGLLGLGIYLPERVMTNDEWAQYVDTSDEWIVARTGIRTRRIVGEEESTADLALAAAQAALADGAFEPADIDEIVLATDTPEVFIPDTAAYVQARLGVGHIPCYDLAGSGCAGFVLALDIARSRALADGRRVLVIGVELLTRLMDWEDRNTCVLFGDAAGAAVVGAGPGAVEIVAATAGTDGSKSDILGVEAGGTRLPITVERVQQGLHKHVVMQGRKVFREAVGRMSAASHEVLAKAGVSIDDVALVVPHQANLRILDAVTKRLGVIDERVFVNVQEYGNTGSASIPVALWEAREQGRIKPGDLVLLTAFGAGFHWAAVLLRF
ncbi:MAG: beta-ketoacyl-ACP synthase 3 [Gemmatimonadetes bacterium]|nr:beta-ketoacyl-ACP synthase 3 [Gemmatimonadota bacterium]